MTSAGNATDSDESFEVIASESGECEQGTDAPTTDQGTDGAQASPFFSPSVPGAVGEGDVDRIAAIIKEVTAESSHGANPECRLENTKTPPDDKLNLALVRSKLSFISESLASELHRENPPEHGIYI